MDWGRAKTVLIYAFLLLNMVLGYQLWADVKETAGSSLDFTSLTENTQRVMDEKQIQVLAPIPNGSLSLPKLSYKYEQNARSPRTELEKPVDSRLVFAKEELTQALRGYISDINSYQYDPLSGDDLSAVSVQENAFYLHPLVEKKWPLFNVNLKLYYSNQKITAYQEPEVELQPSKEEEKVLPAAKALGRLIDNVLPEDSVVKDIQLGYYGQEFNSDTQVAAPAWRFVLESGQVYYVLGSNGDVVSPAKEQPKE
ncbi:two-component system regulatory protein YycI [Paenibacillus sp. JX-17]|uniref:Two-component system regulatory protein YycI n=1 Tax=Paenibacillus lacisoli TaxID=3064525 RepID=A0ABT9CAB9_9BACL|nr:two-component system regulatory protein YycI [Paenibacillus sp. JX-17]MDO7906196.1 two-component system regulatory protein YycI [Paenibacillus sp. JX-17]